MNLATALFRRSAPSVTPLKVAAVCYRWTGLELEFLLVNTGSGKWTFPKGSIEPHLTAAESAAMEAFEEAGVRGRISDQHFDCYLHDKGNAEHLVAAYLMQVRQIFQPQEPHRNPTWFSADEAKRKLAKRRSGKYAQELQRVIDRAVEMLVAPARRTGWARLPLSSLS
ncbi:MAG TPA: NUDIX domain-containing protein [Terriglobales bacterium]|nr:NUDIX domain-containing protein [Terriglobales bacterium]